MLRNSGYPWIRCPTIKIILAYHPVPQYYLALSSVSSPAKLVVKFERPNLLPIGPPEIA
jgi:hypothetical protein